MAPVPNVSPATGKPVPDHYLHSSSAFFQDTNGRSILLRGVNLSGSAKAPVGQPSHSSKGFWEDAEAGKVDITSRPLNLEDGSADIHLARLRAWGYNFIRFVFTWEALEHKGPGKYDEEYIEYVVKALYKCQEWGFRVFMDPHQDVWSRFTGGSGAPLWTLYACGIDPMNITPTYSALVQCEWPNRENARPQDFPAMIWATNYSRLANQTLWTLFFAGRAYAPKCIIDGVNIQDYLQNHFINAVGHLAERLAKEDLFDNVIIGWDGINEPGDGLIGRENLSVMPEDQKLKKGPSPTPFQGMILGMGGKVEADDWTFTSMGPKNNGKVVMDSAGTKLWLAQDQEATRGGGKWGWKRSPDWQMGTCIWAQHGVWEPSTSSLIKPDYFKYSPESATKQTDMLEFWRTHYLAYATLIRKHHPESIHFIQPPVFAVPPSLPESFLAKRACTSPHYYDGLTLMTKHWNWFNADALGLLRGKYWSVVQAIKIGESAIRRCIQDQLGILKQDTRDIYGEYPTVLGEIGCPYDMDDKKAYGFVNGGKGEGDYSAQQKAWDASMNALDGPNCLNYTLWTYVPDNSHQWGDLWNGEDLSIWSADDAKKADLFVDNGNGKSENGKSDGATTSVRSVNGSPKTIAPSPSTASSTTLVSTGANQAHTRENIEQGDGVTAKLILEGSRAIGAVCRPYPIAVVGTPERIDFDIASSEFKLLIKVRANDSVPQGVVTEVYLPFVHYAQSLAPYSSTNLDNASTSTSNASSSLRKDIGSSAATPTTSAAPLRLDVDIDTSIGQVEIQGQMLRWTYPIPQSGEQYYSLKVKRRGGAIKREVGYVQSGGWADVCGSCVIC